ncbi:MAG: BamA/TamA family outer membrane protein [Elusimicrobia bacterium]|nr:BamA/TamA family outer membrane protein [Elusimicrobiota bacterium]
MKKIALLLIILLLVLAGADLQAETLTEAPLEKDLIIRRIEIEGASKLLPFEIAAQMKTKEASWWPWSKPAYFNADTLAMDIEKIHSLYEDNGLYDTQITPEFTSLPKKRLSLVIQIQEGYYFRISKINILNAAHLNTDLKKLLYKSLKVNEKGIFSYQNYKDSKKVILSILADHGYYEAQVSGRVILDRETLQAKVEFSLETGPLQKFGRIMVSGIKKVREGLITRELTFKGDEIFSASKLYHSQQRIFDLGFFKSVILEPVASLQDHSTLDIKLQVEERPFYNLKIGPGYGPEDKARIQAFWKLYNFGRLGGNLESNWKMAQRQHLLVVNYTQPYFSDRYTNLIAGIGYEKDFYDYYRREKESGRGRLTRSLTSKLNTFFGYQVERDLLFLINPNLVFDEKTGFGRKYILSSFEVGFQYKTTEDLFNPKEGQINYFSWEFTPKYIGSSVSYLRGLWEYKYFQPLGRRIVIAWRNQFGYARPIFDSPSIPVFKRFFSGGSYSVRGYSYQGLRSRGENDSPVGGNSQWEGNFEFRFPCYRDFGAVLFYDYGEVFFQTKHYAFNELLTTAGIGLRYNTPLGPLRLDYGYKLKPYQGVDRYKIYLSIGQAF